MARLGFDNYTQMTTIGGNATTNGPVIDTTPLPQDYPTSNQGINWSGIWNGANNFLGSNVGSMLGSIASSIINNYAEDKRAKVQRQWNEDMMDKQNQWSLDMWNRTNEYNSPEEQIKRLTDAGLNPLYFGLDGSSAGQLQSAQPLGYQRGSNPNGIANPIAAYQDATLKQAQIDNINADTTKKLSDTDQTYLENQYLQRTMDARVEGVELSNDLTRGEIKKIEAQIPEIRKHIELMSKQADTELAKQFWYAMDTALKEAEIDKIVTLLPLEVELTKAKTSHEKAVASLAMVEEAYKQKLIDGGYIDAMISEMDARARKAGADADIVESSVELKKRLNDLKQGVDSESGISKWFAEHPNMKAAHPALAFLSGDMWRIFNNMKETGVFDFLTILGVGKMIGSGIGKSGRVTVENKTSYPTMYGAKGEPVSYNTTRSSNW